MSVPNYQSIMLPLLQVTADGKEHRLRDLYGELADFFQLTSEEREELLPSGKAPKINNRVQWAKVYLLKARLLESPSRGIVKIADRGRKLLAENPTKIDVKLLMGYSEFAEFKAPSKTEQSQSPAESTIDDERTPDELLESAFESLRETLAKELLDQIGAVSPSFFERLVVELLVEMGYGGSIEDAGRVIGRSHDGGIDGIIKEDRLGLDNIYIQAKRWTTSVGRPEIQKFVGALQGERSRKGVFITTSSFSKEARQYAASVENNIVLIDGDALTQLMIDFDIGVSTVETYVTKRVDSDYFLEE